MSAKFLVLLYIAVVTYEASAGTGDNGDIVKIHSCSTDDEQLDKTCQKAIDGNFNDCKSSEKVFISALQGNQYQSRFGHWLIGRFDALVKLEKVLYLPRSDKYSMSSCRMCHFWLLFGFPDFKEYETFAPCHDRVETTVPFKRKLIECKHTTYAIKLWDDAVSSQNNDQYLQVCELTAFGVKIGPNPMIPRRPRQAGKGEEIYGHKIQGDDKKGIVRFKSCTQSSTYNGRRCEYAMAQRDAVCSPGQLGAMINLDDNEGGYWFGKLPEKTKIGKVRVLGSWIDTPGLPNFQIILDDGRVCAELNRAVFHDVAADFNCIGDSSSVLIRIQDAYNKEHQTNVLTALCEVIVYKRT